MTRTLPWTATTAATFAMFTLVATSSAACPNGGGYGGYQSRPAYAPSYGHHNAYRAPVRQPVAPVTPVAPVAPAYTAEQLYELFQQHPQLITQHPQAAKVLQERFGAFPAAANVPVAPVDPVIDGPAAPTNAPIEGPAVGGEVVNAPIEGDGLINIQAPIEGDAEAAPGLSVLEAPVDGAELSQAAGGASVIR